MKQRVFGGVFLLSLLAPLAFAGAVRAEERGWLGVEVQQLSEALSQALEYEGNGVLVNEVIEESPAAQAGIEVGDIIRKFDGKEVTGIREFVDMVRDTEPGTRVKLLVVRKGQEKQIEAQIAGRERPEFFGKAWKNFKGFHRGNEGCLGVRVEDLGEELGEYFATEEGALVLSVKEESAASKAGMKAGDVIKEIDGSRIHDAADVFEILGHKEKGDQVTVTILRKGQLQNLTITLGGCEEYGMRWCASPEGGSYSYHWPHGGCLMLPDPAKMEIDIQGLEESLERGDLGRRIEKEIRVFGDVSEEKLEALEKSLAKLEEEVARLKEKMND